MNVQSAVGLALLVGGLVWLGFGIHAADAPLERFAEAFTGRYTQDTQWSLIGGAVLATAGAALAFGTLARR